MIFLQFLIMSGVQFQILMPSLLKVDLKLSEPCLIKSPFTVHNVFVGKEDRLQERF